MNVRAPIDDPSAEQVAIDEHFDECSFLWLQRQQALHAPHYSFRQFHDLDEQLIAHLDGLQHAGDEGWALCVQSLDNEGPEDFFVATVLALDDPGTRWRALLERVRHAPEVSTGVTSALAWSGPSRLRHVVRDLLEDRQPLFQHIAVATCALHRRAPLPSHQSWISSPHGSVRARALRAAGELGAQDALPAILEALHDRHQDIRYWSAWSACLLGAAEAAQPVLRSLALTEGRFQAAALRAALLSLTPEEGHELLSQVDSSPAGLRTRIIGAGYTGDPSYLPWLVELMDQAPLARVAFEAFVLITGADINAEGLETSPPEELNDGPNDDPEDDDVALPEDLPLPWPNVDSVRQWWLTHRTRYRARRRLLLGHPAELEQCQQVLKIGTQRQRGLAAELACRQAPGRVLFPTTAPAWRQQRWMQDQGTAI